MGPYYDPLNECTIPTPNAIEKTTYNQIPFSFVTINLIYSHSLEKNKLPKLSCLRFDFAVR